MFKLMDKKIITIFRSKSLFSRPMEIKIIFYKNFTTTSLITHQPESFLERPVSQVINFTVSSLITHQPESFKDSPVSQIINLTVYYPH